MTEYLTTNEVIDALGGTGSVARVMNVRAQVVTNWRAMEKFPAHTYLAIKAALREKGKTAPDNLWRMSQPITAAE